MGCGASRAKPTGRGKADAAAEASPPERRPMFGPSDRPKRLANRGDLRFQWPMEGSCEVLFFERTARLVTASRQTCINIDAGKHDTHESALLTWRQDASTAGLRVRFTGFKTHTADSSLDVLPLNLALEFLVSPRGEFVCVTDASHSLAQAFLATSSGVRRTSTSQGQGNLRENATKALEQRLRFFWSCVVQSWCVPAPETGDVVEIRAPALKCVGSAFLSSMVSASIRRAIELDEPRLNELEATISSTCSTLGAAVVVPPDLAIDVASVELIERVAVETVEDCLMPVFGQSVQIKLAELVGTGVSDMRFADVMVRGFGFLHPEVMRAGLVSEFAEQSAAAVTFARDLCMGSDTWTDGRLLASAAISRARLASSSSIR